MVQMCGRADHLLHGPETARKVLIPVSQRCPARPYLCSTALPSRHAAVTTEQAQRDSKQIMVVTAQSEVPHSCLLCPVLGYIRSDLESQVCELKKSGDCFSDCILGVCSLPLPVTITLVLFRLSKSQPSPIRTRFKTDDKASCGVTSCTMHKTDVSGKSGASKYRNAWTCPGSCVRLVECVAAPDKIRKCKYRENTASES